LPDPFPPPEPPLPPLPEPLPEPEPPSEPLPEPLPEPDPEPEPLPEPEPEPEPEPPLPPEPPEPEPLPPPDPPPPELPLSSFLKFALMVTSPAGMSNLAGLALLPPSIVAPLTVQPVNSYPLLALAVTLMAAPGA
jgi:hypothetical protein